jgi:2-polyprenyl-3-methyl-5-hydroxy-6-metoxy-1,4-benzoquinol methylase
MVQTEKDRQHKKRQQKRHREHRQESLEELLQRIPPLSQSLLAAIPSTNPTTATSSSIYNNTNTASCQIIQEVYQPIPPLEMDFWNHVPPMCNPMTATMEYSSASTTTTTTNNIGGVVDQGKWARHEQIQQKRKRKLAARAQRGEITKEEHEHLWNQHGRATQKQEKKNKDDDSSTNYEACSLLSANRGQRKVWQVENFVSLLKDRLLPGMTVVDFGSGSGNLCLALAAYFSEVQFVLVDRNEFSLQLVQKRADISKLPNVSIQQFVFTPDNLRDYRPPPVGKDAKEDDQTKMPFDLGIGLHCCGSFTDMVMEACLYHGADCIVCPCCNGGMTAKATGGFNYPRSGFLQQCMTQDEYLSQLSRHADNAQNYAAKCWIEYDRALWAKEQGGTDVELWKMEPISCTPKHHVLFIKNNRIRSRDSLAA